VVCGRGVRLLARLLRELHPWIPCRVRLRGREVEQQPERQQVQLDGARLVLRGETGHPCGHLVHRDRGRLAVTERLRRLLERGPVVLRRVRVDIDPRREVLLAPRGHGHMRCRCRQRGAEDVGGVASGCELAADQVAAGPRLPHCLERSAVLDRVRPTAEPIADVVARRAVLRLARRNGDGGHPAPSFGQTPRRPKDRRGGRGGSLV
jgi:hypothetical protein